MTAPPTPAGMPKLPLVERWEFGPSQERLIEYGRQCYEAGRTHEREAGVPVGAAFQHDETARTVVLDVNVDEFLKKNPRFRFIGPVYLHPPVAAAIRSRGAK